jgi:hypothetical protein
MSNQIIYRIGDATMPFVSANSSDVTVAPTDIIIPHICNDLGKWGAGFVLALSRRYPEPEAAYRHWFSSGSNHLPFLSEARHEPFELGYTQFVPVVLPSPNFTSADNLAQAPRLWVANMLAQHGVANRNRSRLPQQPPIRYPELQCCLAQVGEFARGLIAAGSSTVSTQMPRIGAGLGGGNWEIIVKLIEQELVCHGIEVTVFDLH